MRMAKIKKKKEKVREEEEGGESRTARNQNKISFIYERNELRIC